MLSRSDLSAAVFIGGMEGVEAEFALYRSLHPAGKVIPVPAPGGAARSLAQHIGISDSALEDLNFARLFQRELDLGADEG
jgi:hypothetical protein